MSPRLSAILADAVVIIHLGYVVFVLVGGLLLPRRPGLVWLHLPAVAWAAAVELCGWICPLTPVENWLRRHSGVSPYRGDFIDTYLLPLLYPAGLTRGHQIFLGFLVLLMNLWFYHRWWQAVSKGRQS